MNILAALYFSLFISLIVCHNGYLNHPRNEIRVEKLLPRLFVEPSEKLKNGDFIKIAWSGVPNSNTSDQIGLYCPTTEEDSKELRRYKHGKYRTIGRESGFFIDDIFFPRNSCHFRYLQKGSDEIYRSIAQSNEISFDHEMDEPMHIHIALTNIQTEMRIMWVSGSKLTPYVKFGLSSLDMNFTKLGTTSTYSSNDMCEPPATTVGYMDPGFLHEVLLQNLLPNTYYYYKVGNENAHSQIFKFKSAILSNNSIETSPFTIDVFGDLDVSKFPGGHGTIMRIKEEINGSSPPDLILHIGDISYARGYAYIWEEFGYLIEPVSSRVPYMFSIGNHEHDYINGSDKDPSHDGPNFRPHWGNYRYDSGGECSVPMVYRYHMPDNGNKIFWYSFNYGLAHIIQFSVEHNFTVGSNQYKWLEQDLMNVDRKNTPWVIVTTHRPMYCSIKSPFENPVTTHIRDNIEPLILKYKVDFFMNGHFHFYERTCAMKYQTCVEGKLSPDNWGVVHLIVGAGGKKMDDFDLFQNPWSLSKHFSFGHGRIHITNSTNAEWVYIANIDGKSIDSVTFERDHNFKQFS